jgi:hypothetical protein
VGSEEATAALARPGYLADLLNVPLFPGTGGLRLPLAGVLPLPSRWTLRFGPAVDQEGRAPDAAEDPTLVAAVTTRTRDAVQALLEAGLAGRRSVFA